MASHEQEAIEEAWKKRHAKMRANTQRIRLGDCGEELHRRVADVMDYILEEGEIRHGRDIDTNDKVSWITKTLKQLVLVKKAEASVPENVEGVKKKSPSPMIPLPWFSGPVMFPVKYVVVLLLSGMVMTTVIVVTGNAGDFADAWLKVRGETPRKVPY